MPLATTGEPQIVSSGAVSLVAQRSLAVSASYPAHLEAADAVRADTDEHQPAGHHGHSGFTRGPGRGGHTVQRLHRVAIEHVLIAIEAAPTRVEVLLRPVGADQEAAVARRCERLPTAIHECAFGRAHAGTVTCTSPAPVRDTTNEPIAGSDVVSKKTPTRSDAANPEPEILTVEVGGPTVGERLIEATLARKRAVAGTGDATNAPTSAATTTIVNATEPRDHQPTRTRDR